MTEHNLYLLRQARQNLASVKRRIDTDLQNGELTQNEWEIIRKNISRAISCIGVAIARLRGPVKQEGEQGNGQD